MFWDKISGIYDLYQIVNKKVNDKAAFLCAKQIKSNDIVLECACGTGIMTKFIAPCCKKLVATDFSRKMLNIIYHMEQIPNQQTIPIYYIPKGT